MSKERELLKRILKANNEGYLSFFGFASLKNTIENILTQPDQEGVYQKLLRIEDGIEVEIFPSELWMDGYETGRKELKREPLSEDDLEDRYANCEYDICYMDYRAGFRDAEKAHGIGVDDEY